jgi:CHAT domain/HEAT repeats
MDTIWELMIGSAGERYSFTLLNPVAGGLAFKDKLRVPPGIRADILGRLPNETSNLTKLEFEEQLTDAGRLVFHRMFPKSIQTALVELASGHLAISTDDPSIPWELAFTGTDFLARHFAVARRMHTKAISQEGLRSQRPWLEMLVIANPTGDLLQAEEEGHAIARYLAKEPLIRVTALTGEEATIGRVADELAQRQFDVLHYAGHVEHAGGEEESTLLLSDDQVTGSYLSQLFSGGPPEVVFINGCESGRSSFDSTSRKGQQVTDMAENFLTIGVRSYVGTLWHVTDAAAFQVATRFYSELVHGASVGMALLHAREAARSHGPAAWAAYVLFGRPNEVVQGVQPAIQRRRRLSGLRQMMSSDSEPRRRRAAIVLGELSYEEATDTLVRALEDENAPVRWRAVEGLTKIGTPQALTALAKYLPRANIDSQLHILVVIRGHVTSEQAPWIVTLAEDSEDRLVRANAIITLTWARDIATLPTFIRLLSEGDDLLQWFVMDGLARLGDEGLKQLERYQPDNAMLEGKRQRILEKAR